MKTLIYLLILLSLPLPVFAAYIDLPRDANGWTIFTPSSDSDVVYVDSTRTGGDTDCRSYRTSDGDMGSDPFNPAGTVLACETVAKAQTLVGESQPDWILFKRGSVFNSGLVLTRQIGKSISEPRVFATYGSSGAMPVFRDRFATDGNSDAAYLAISGLDFYRDVNDPNSPNYAPEITSSTGIFMHSHVAYEHTGILIEGCKIRWFQNNINGQTEGNGTSSGVTVRRNVIHDASSRSGGDSSGLLISGINGLLIEENIIDNNGWRIQNDGDGLEDVGEATIRNHNMYLSANQNATIRKNIFMRPSSINAKIANYSLTTPIAGLVVDNNLFIDGDIGVSIGASDQALLDAHTEPVISNNVFLHIGLSNPTNREIAWAFYDYNIDRGNFVNNMMLHQESATITSGKFLYNGFNHNGSTYTGNVVYNCLNTDAFESTYDDADELPMTGSFSNNRISGIDGRLFNFPDVADISGFSFSGNSYDTTEIADTWFYVNGANKTNAQWVTLTEDDSTFEAATYSDSTRDIDTYMTSLGETATLDAFIAAARSQDRYNWDARFTADAVNDYIRAGFGMSEYTPPGQARRLSLSGSLIKIAEPGP